MLWHHLMSLCPGSLSSRHTVLLLFLRPAELVPASGPLYFLFMLPLCSFPDSQVTCSLTVVTYFQRGLSWPPVLTSCTLYPFTLLFSYGTYHTWNYIMCLLVCLFALCHQKVSCSIKVALCLSCSPLYSWPLKRPGPQETLNNSVEWSGHLPWPPHLVKISGGRNVHKFLRVWAPKFKVQLCKLLALKTVRGKWPILPKLQSPSQKNDNKYPLQRTGGRIKWDNECKTVQCWHIVNAQ